MAFADTWTELRRYLCVCDVVPNWTAHRGTIGEDFRIAEVSTDYLKVEPPSAKMIQRIPKDDFEAVYDLWNDYRRTEMPRSNFNPLTRYSKCVISILDFLEAKCGGKLP